MDQWRSKFSESFSLDQYWSVECSSLPLSVPGKTVPAVPVSGSGSVPGPY